jgi:integrase
VPDKNDKSVRLPLDDNDMKQCRDKLDNLSHSDQLLWIWLASTGMRLGELFQIDEEFSEGGIRYVITGSKTDQSRRRIPIPDVVLPLAPGRITRPLFTGGAPAASKRLNRFITKTAKITDERKVLHSLRHRAQDMLRAASCPLDLREELLGHEEVTISKSYGRGSPMPTLKSWIDKIGW